MLSLFLSSGVFHLFNAGFIHILPCCITYESHNLPCWLNELENGWDYDRLLLKISERGHVCFPFWYERIPWLAWSTSGSHPWSRFFSTRIVKCVYPLPPKNPKLKNLKSKSDWYNVFEIVLHHFVVLLFLYTKVLCFCH